MYRISPIEIEMKVRYHVAWIVQQCVENSVNACRSGVREVKQQMSTEATLGKGNYGEKINVFVFCDCRCGDDSGGMLRRLRLKGSRTQEGLEACVE